MIIFIVSPAIGNILKKEKNVRDKNVITRFHPRGRNRSNKIVEEELSIRTTLTEQYHGKSSKRIPTQTRYSRTSVHTYVRRD